MWSTIRGQSVISSYRFSLLLYMCCMVDVMCIRGNRHAINALSFWLDVLLHINLENRYNMLEIPSHTWVWLKCDRVWWWHFDVIFVNLLFVFASSRYAHCHYVVQNVSWELCNISKARMCLFCGWCGKADKLA